MTTQIDHSTAHEVRTALRMSGRVYEATSMASGWHVAEDSDFYGAVLVSYEEKSFTSYSSSNSAESRARSIASTISLYREILKAAGYEVKQWDEMTLSVHMPTDRELSFVKQALGEAREAVERLSMRVMTRKAGPWSIFVYVVDERMPERTRRGELSYDTESGYKFSTFLYRGERTRNLAQVVKEIAQELVETD